MPDGASWGPNNGLHGAFELPLTMGGAASAILYAKVLSFAITNTSNAVPRGGRGDSDNFGKFRVTSAAAGGSASGEVESSSAPLQSDWRNKTATLKQYIDQERYSTRTVKIDSFEIERPEKGKNTCAFTITWTALTAETYSFPTGSTHPGGATDLAKADQQQWLGTVKGYDPQGIAPPETVITIDWWDDGVANTDAAEQTKLLAAVSAYTAPLTSPHSYKLRGVSFTRDAFNGGRMTLAAGLTDTQEDIENPATVTDDDSSDLSDTKTIRLVQGSITPTPPSVPTGHKLVHTESLELNDSKFQHTFYYARRTNQEAVEFDGSELADDPSDLADTRNITLVQATAVGTATPPSTPAGLVLRRKSSVQIHDASTGAKWKNTYFYARRTEAEDVTFPGTVSTDDQSDLADEATITIIDDDTPVAPSTPSGLKLVDIRREQLTDAGKYKWTYIYKRTTRKEDIERDGTEVDYDGTDLESKAQQTFVYNDGDVPPDSSDVTIDLPADVEVVEQTYQQLNDGKWKTAVKWAMRNAKHAIEWLRSITTTDVGHVAQTVRVVKVLSTATPAADDTYNPDTTNLEFDTVEVNRDTNSQYVHVYTFSPLSAKNRKIEGFKEVADDPVSFLIGDDKRSIIDANATTSAPTVSGQVCVRRVTQKIGRGLYEHKFWFAFRSLADQAVAAKTTTTIDGSFIESEAITAEVYAIAGSPAGAGSAPFTNAVNISYTDINTDNPAYMLRVYKWSYTTEANKRIYAASGAKSDPLDGYEYTQASIVANSIDDERTIAIAARTTNSADASFVEAQVKRLTPNYVLKILIFTGEDKKIHSMSAVSRLRTIRGKPLSFGNPNSLVKLIAPGVFGGLGGYAYGWVQPLEVWETIITFKYRRRYTTDTTPSVKRFVGSFRTVNSATFLDFGANKVMYEGMEELFNFGGSGTRLQVEDHAFAFREITLPDGTFISGHFADGQLPTDKVYAYYPGSLFSGTVYLNPKTYIDPSADLVWAQANDFSIFT